jgi:hypothetical protein
MYDSEGQVDCLSYYADHFIIGLAEKWWTKILFYDKFYDYRNLLNPEAINKWTFVRVSRRVGKETTQLVEGALFLGHPRTRHKSRKQSKYFRDDWGCNSGPKHNPKFSRAYPILGVVQFRKGIRITYTNVLARGGRSACRLIDVACLRNARSCFMALCEVLLTLAAI